MKRVFVFLTLLAATAVSVSAQNQIRERRVSEQPAAPIEKPARTRVVTNERDANHVRQPESPVLPSKQTNSRSRPAWGDTAVTFQQPPKTTTTPIVSANTTSNSNSLAQPKLVKPTNLAISNAPTPNKSVAVTASNGGTNAASVYRVGVGDVLDIRLSNLATRESTLFTVLKNGSLEYPLLDKPLPVAGLTTDEIARRFNTEVKVIQNARASVAVRDYASHSVVITGAVDNPGQKILRREAMPLFAILAEALPRKEATAATILRSGKEISISLSNNEQLATLVMAGDAIKVSSVTKQFVYVGGAVAAGGEKEFRDGMTLTQAVLASGGTLREAGSKIKIVRRSTNGFLVTQEYDLNEINAGKAPDPNLEPGDRIDLARR